MTGVDGTNDLSSSEQRISLVWIDDDSVTPSSTHQEQLTYRVSVAPAGNHPEAATVEEPTVIMAYTSEH